MKTWTRTLAGFALATLASVSPAQVIGPSPYLSTADSPFNPSSFLGYFHLDDMEDGFLDTPGVSANMGFVFGPTSSTDSVDGDDGSIDGSGLMGKSFLVAGSGNPQGVFTFDGHLLGTYPTHAGIVVTDAHDPVFVEGITYNGASLGVVQITGYGPPPDTQGQTAEDRFVGFIHPDGIWQILVSTQGNGGIEVDHIQYGAEHRPFTTFCPGDGTGTPCPCGNNGASGNGCANSIEPAGAILVASGLASVAFDSVLLQGAGMPANFALYYQGTNQINSGNGVAFGDGLRCVSGTIVRLAQRFNTFGVSQVPGPGEPALSTLGGVQPGQTRHYQVWYRNSEVFCVPATHNLTNGMTIRWSP